jgi:hypothetical protein
MMAREKMLRDICMQVHGLNLGFVRKTYDTRSTNAAPFKYIVFNFDLKKPLLLATKPVLQL